MRRVALRCSFDNNEAIERCSPKQGEAVDVVAEEGGALEAGKGTAVGQMMVFSLCS